LSASSYLILCTILGRGDEASVDWLDFRGVEVVSVCTFLVGGAQEIGEVSMGFITKIVLI